MAQQASIRSPCSDKAADKRIGAARPVKIRLVLCIALFVICIVAVAFGAVQSSWAQRMLSNAAVHARASEEWSHVRYHPGPPKDPLRRDADDYVEGLARRGIANIPGYEPIVGFGFRDAPAR
jgi:hypothetical protein